MLLWRQAVLQEVPRLWSLHFLETPLAAADLDCVDTVRFLAFNLDDLAAIDLQDGAWTVDAPTIPEVCHANLEAEESNSF